MTDRERCNFPYTLMIALVGFLTGVLAAILRSRRTIIQHNEVSMAPVSPPSPKEIPAEAIILPDTLPKGALPPPDELTLIEGIGPKVEAVLHTAGIRSLEQLAHTTTADLKAILVAAGNRISNPETWPKQAELALAAKWDELKALQTELKAGRKAVG